MNGEHRNMVSPPQTPPARLRPFSAYLSTSFQAGLNHFGRILVVALIAGVGILTGIFILVGYFSKPYYFSFHHLGGASIVGELFLMSLVLVVVIWLCCFAQGSIFALTEGYVKGKKRFLGDSLSFGAKRAFPLFGTYLWIGFFSWIIIVIFKRLEIFFVGSRPANLAGFAYLIRSGGWQALALYLATIIIVHVLISIYGFVPFARMRYKVSGIESLNLSRKLTKGDRLKVFGNMLLFNLIYTAVLLAFTALLRMADGNGLFRLELLIGIAQSFCLILLAPFSGVIFTDFDGVKGQIAEVESERNVMEEYFVQRDLRNNNSYVQVPYPPQREVYNRQPGTPQAGGSSPPADMPASNTKPVSQPEPSKDGIVPVLPDEEAPTS